MPQHINVTCGMCAVIFWTYFLATGGGGGGLEGAHKQEFVFHYPDSIILWYQYQW